MDNGQQVNVDLSQAQDVTCENCNNYTFQEVVLMKRLSAILSPTGKEALVPIPVFACNSCGWINERFLPATMRGTATRPPSEDGEDSATLPLSDPPGEKRASQLKLEL